MGTSKYNEISGDINFVPGMILYLQPKREKAEARGRSIIMPVTGDSMYLISQRFGVKLKSLYVFEQNGGR